MTNQATHQEAYVVKPRSKEHFRAELLTIARKMFLERGVEATSMCDLGRALGVSKPTVYEAFESKQALVHAVFLSASRDVDLSWIANAVRTPVSFSTFLDQTCEAFKASLRAPHTTEVYQLVIREGVHSSELLTSFGKYMVEPSVQAMRLIIVAAMERGECRHMEVQVVQKLLVSPLYFLMSDRAMFGAHSMSPDLGARYLDACFSGMKTHLCVPARDMSNSLGVPQVDDVADGTQDAA